MKGTQYAFVVCPGPGCVEVFVPHIDKGRKREFCSRRCFQRVYRLERYGPPPMAQCAGPDCDVPVVANRTRLYCSPQCRQRAHYMRDPQRGRNAVKEWKARRKAAGFVATYDPVKSAAYWNRRRARLAAADTRKVTARDIARLYARQGGCCLACGERARLTLDHLIPISRGGRHAIGNLAGLCGPCNSSKRDLTWMEFRTDRIRGRRVA